MIALAIAVFLGLKFNINTGLIAIAFTYLAVLILNITDINIFTLWPSQLFIMIFAVSIFYSFASINGAIEKLAMKVLYKFRNTPRVLPIAIYLITAFIAGSRGGPYVSTIVMTPIVVRIAILSNMSPLLGVIAIVTASGGASLFQVSLVGTLIRGFIENTIFAETASSLVQEIFYYGFIFHTIMFVLFYFLLRGYNIKPISMQQPEPFTMKQKLSLVIVASTVLLYVMPSILLLILPGNHILLFAKSKFNFTFFAVLASLICFLFGLGNERDVFNWIPWKTMILISGVGMFVGLADAIGLMELLARSISSSLPKQFVASTLAAIGGAMSYVSDGPGVVFPTLFPLVPELSLQTGLGPALLYAAVSIGVSTTTMSPFSTGGAMFLSFVQDEKIRNKLFVQLIFVPLFFLIALPIWIYITYMIV